MSDAVALWDWTSLVDITTATADGQPAAGITGISIDTRTLAPGDIFVALKDQRDGHAFVSQAFEKGASAAIVSHIYERETTDGALLRVNDPLDALARIGVAARARLPSEARVVAVTGSAGKTGTKEMLRECLATAGKVHASERSYNNHWGVPLTLARMPADVRYAVIEMGMNHPGEISPLARMARPHVAVITNVLPVHIGQFPNGEDGIADAKAEIFDGLEPGGVAVLNRDNAHFERLARAAEAKGATVLSFGQNAEADIRADKIDAGPDGSSVSVTQGQQTFTYGVGAAGLHIALNSLAVVGVLIALGVAGAAALAPLATVRAAAGRGERSILAADGGSILLIDESYNANPGSMRAALEALGTVPRDRFARRIAVLGDMLELGSDAGLYHRGLRPAVEAAGVDRIFGCGSNMRLLLADLPTEIVAEWRPTSQELIDAVLSELHAGDAVMVKGSLGSRMAPIVDAIKKRFAVVAGDA
jgi:UDP-N-acetylmuramoyl-tripeptide--D-alanyl-D-alanine ligase